MSVFLHVFLLGTDNVNKQYFSILCHRYAFHPLRSYGGPSLAHLTDAYGGFQALHGRSHLDTYENHLKYGSVFRQGPNKLVFNTIAALQGALKRCYM